MLMVCQNYYPEIGSAGNRMQNITHLMKQRGYEVEVITAAPSYPSFDMYQDDRFWNDRELNNQPFIKRLITKKRKHTSNMVSRLLLFLEQMVKGIGSVRQLKLKPDVVFATTPSFFMAFVGVYAKRKYRVPLILDVRDLWPESVKGVGVFKHDWVLAPAFWLEKRLYRAADEVIINSEGFRSYLRQRGVPNEKIHYMPNSIRESERTLERTIPPDDRMEILYAGNMGLAQDVSLLLELAERFRDEPRIHFKLIGYGYRKEELKQTIKERGFQNFLFLEAMPRTEAFQAIKNADVAFVSLIEQEVFDTVIPGKLIDYMAVGKPIVAAVSGHAANVIEAAEVGFVSRKRDIDEIERILRKLLDRPDLRETLGANGIRYVKENLCWEENIDVLDQVVQQLVMEETR
ncbi:MULTISPECIES: glycosyltransferase family 4 protein [unclassified Exiguobacterium]|uniref:glycosyltransferase family 4 protein n=1 Tax=unclassified Exiguobacterium TaxID=2644629 RepID=UPI00203689FF|nr:MULTISPECIES: glycosyltransferase family 4 protein [unclassified Exiguobacterium]